MSKQQVTTKKYKIEAIIVGIFIVATFFFRDLMIYRTYIESVAYSGAYKYNLFEWIIVKRGWYLLGGLIVCLIPYEKIYGIIKAHIGVQVQKSVMERKYITLVAVLTLLVIEVVSIILMPIEYQKISLIFNAGIVLAVFLCLSPLILEIINWFIIVIIYNVISVWLVYFISKLRIENGYEYAYIEDWRQFVVVFISMIFIVISIVIGIFIYAFLSKNAEVRKWPVTRLGVVAIISTVIVVDISERFLFSAHRALQGYDLNAQYFINGTAAFKDTGYIIVSVLFIFSIILLFIAAKLISSYSKKRMLLLLWSAVLMIMLGIWEIQERFGLIDRIEILNTIFDPQNLAIMFIALRTLVIPVKPEPDIESIDDGMDSYIEIQRNWIQINSLNKQIMAVTDLINAHELRLEMLDAKIESMNAKSEEEAKKCKDYIDKIESGLDENAKKGMSTKCEQMYDELEQIAKHEIDEINELYELFGIDKMDENENL